MFIFKAGSKSVSDSITEFNILTVCVPKYQFQRWEDKFCSYPLKLKAWSTSQWKDRVNTSDTFTGFNKTGVLWLPLSAALRDKPNSNITTSVNTSAWLPNWSPFHVFDVAAPVPQSWYRLASNLFCSDLEQDEKWFFFYVGILPHV
jgi:hypothetical protein